MSIAPSVPSIPPGFLQEWCSTLAADTEMPPAAYLATGLVSVASIVGPRLYIRFSHTRRERCNVWVANVGRSALARKTTGMSAARWAVKVAADELGDGIRWYAPQRMSDAQMAVDLDVVGPDTEAARKEEKAKAKAEGREPDPIRPVVRPVPVAWCMTLNELAKLWGDGGREWQQATQAALLELFDGELSSNTRQSFVQWQETFVCALGNIPPSELTSRTTLGMLTSGFAGRWLVMGSPAPVAPISAPSLNGTDPMSGLARRLRHLAELAADAGAGIDAIKLWSEDALELRDEWYRARWHEHVAADPESPEAVAKADLWARLQATAIKVATIIAVARQEEGLASLEQVRVQARDAAWAQSRVDEGIGVLMAALGESGGGTSSSLGRVENRVIHALRRRGIDAPDKALTFTAVANVAKGGEASRRDVISALEALAAVGAVEVVEVPPKGAGTKPARGVYLPATD